MRSRQRHPPGASFVVAAALLAAAGDPAAAQVQFAEVSAAAGISNELYRSSTFHSLGVNWIDYDEDNWPDLFTVAGNPGNPPRLYHNDRDGTFTRLDELIAALPAVEMSGSRFADYDNDGDSDIYIYTDNEIWDPQGTQPPDGPADILLRNLWVENGHGTVPG
ncbi:MAG: FG-GAP repeat domain-containing protein, partial [Thermoanaerobaculia bacterium]